MASELGKDIMGGFVYVRKLEAVAKAAREVVFMPSQDNPAWDRLTLALDALAKEEGDE